jgi:surface carbohydrate biosynthesis protein (TIGR04326 family)
LKNRSIIICDNEESVLYNSNVYYWNGYIDKDSGKSLLKILEDNSDELRQQFFEIRTDFLNILSKNIETASSKNIGNQLLWMSLLVESGPIKSPNLLDVFRLLTIDKFLVNPNTKIIKYLGSKKSIAKSLKKLCFKSNINFKWEKTSNINRKNLFGFKEFNFGYTLHSILWFIKFIIQHWSLKKLAVPNWFTQSNSIFIFSYFAHLDKNSCDSGKFYSDQWGVLPKLLKDSGKLINWVHFFIFSDLVRNTKTGITWLKLFNKNKVNKDVHFFLQSIIDFKIIFKSLFNWFQMQLFYFRSAKKIEDPIKRHKYDWLWPVLKNDWKNSMIGASSIDHILLINLFDELLKKMPHQKVGFYLYENQGWEQAFLRAWKKYNHGKIIGIAHSTIRYWDLRYYNNSLIDKFSNYYKPDLIAVNGISAWSNLKDAGYSMNNCVPVEAIRYLYLNEVKRSIQIKKYEQTKNKRLLLLGDIQFSTTDRMLKVVESYKRVSKNSFEIWIKPHPHNPIDLAKYHSLNLIQTNDRLIKLLPKIDILLTSVYTSADLDGFCSGLPVINYIDPFGFNYSNLRHVKDSYFISSSNELDAVIRKIASDNYKVNNNEEYFWLNQTLPKWKDLLERFD